MTQTDPLTSNADDVLCAIDAGIATLTLNRPARYNTLTSAVIAAISDHLTRLAVRDDVRAVILAATGKAFSTGHDLKEMHT